MSAKRQGEWVPPLLFTWATAVELDILMHNTLWIDSLERTLGPERQP